MTPNTKRTSALAGRALRLDGTRCRELRQRKGLSREGLAALSNGVDSLSLATIKRAELGQAIYANSAGCLARLLGVQAEDLLSVSYLNQVRAAARENVRSSRAAIAVATFECLDDDERVKSLAVGIAEGIANRLVPWWFPVIGRSSTFVLSLEAMNRQTLVESLGADYLVEGIVRTRGTRVRVLAKLIECATWVQIWSREFDADIPDLFELEDQVVSAVAGRVGGEVMEMETRVALRYTGGDLDAWRLALQGVRHFYHGTREGNAKARELFRQSMQIDEHNPLPRFFAVLSLEWDLVHQWTTDYGATRAQMLEQTVALEGCCAKNSWVCLASAFTRVAHGDRGGAMLCLLEALKLNPNSVDAHSLYGQTLAMSGQADQGLHELEFANLLAGPCAVGTAALSTATSLIHLGAGHYDDAATLAMQAVHSSQLPLCRVALTAALSELGETTRAMQIGKTLKSEGWRELSPFSPVVLPTRTEVVEPIREALRRAGLDGRGA